MEAIILAGGKGTRLFSMVSNVPKPMAIVNNKPFLEYLLDYLSYSGIINKVIIAVGYKKEYIINYFGNKYKNIDIRYSLEEEPLGTGGCIKKAIVLCESELIFAINGDTFFNVDISDMIKYYKAQNIKSLILIAGKYLNMVDRYGTLEIDNNNFINNFLEKSFLKEGYVNGGVYLFNKDVFLNYDLKAFSMEIDFLQKNIRNLVIKIYKSTGYFIDIGVPDDYLKAQKDFLDEKNTIFG